MIAREVERSQGLIGRIDASGVPLLIARFVVGGWFIYLGILKLENPFNFLTVLVEQYKLFPANPPYLANTLGAVQPWLEIIIGLAFIAGVYLRGAAALTLILLGVFSTVVLLHALDVYANAHPPMSFWAINFDCGCGTGAQTAWSKLAENAALFLLCLPILFSRSRRFCLSKRDAFASAAAA